LSLLTRYLVREFLRLFFLCLAGGTVLFLVIDLFDRIDRFVRYGGTIKWIFLYFLYKLPFIIYQIIPATMLLSVLLTLGLMVRHNEILALRTNGVPVWRISYPFVIISLLVSISAFLLNELVVPGTYQQSEYIQKVLIKGETPSSLVMRDRIWFNGEEWMYNIVIFFPVKKELHGVMLFKIDRPFKLTRRIDAAKAVWKDQKWVFYDVTERFFQEGRIVQTLFSPEKELVLSETPEDFMHLQRETEEMPFAKLRQYTKKVAAEGYDPTPYLVALHKKIAFPVLNIITVFLGIPFALRLTRYGGLVGAIGISLVLGFLYWVLFAVTISVGQLGYVPPFIAAWSTNMLFAALGIYLLLRVEEQPLN